MDSDIEKEDTLLLKHAVIRLLILFVPLIAMFIIAVQLDSELALLILFAGYLSPIAGFIFLIIETFVLHSKKKADLRKINLILIFVFLPIYILILINHP